MSPIENPFPGMNPFLQEFWPDVHTSLAVYLRNALQPQLPGGLFARVEESVAIDTDDQPHLIRPDVLVAHVWGGGQKETMEGGVALLEPDIYATVEAETQRRVEIIDLRGGGRVVTVIELLSPTNKNGGRKAYRTKSHLLREAGVNLVEVDLVRGGVHVLAVPFSTIPEARRTPYAVCVSPAAKYGVFHVWHIGLLDRLPAIPIPLREEDAPVIVELQPLLDAAFHDGRYDQLIDYDKPLDPPLLPEALERVRQSGTRPS